MTAPAVIVNEAFELRPAGAEDVGFIRHSWLHSYRHNAPWAEAIPGPVYYPEHAGIIAKLIQRSSCVVACSPEDSSQVMGWCVAQRLAGKSCLHFVYVKQPFRGFGIARALLHALDVRDGWCSHLTEGHGVKLAAALKLVFNPYVLGGVP